MKILIFQRIMPSYRVPIFREFFKKWGWIVCHSQESRFASLKDESKPLDFVHERITRFYFSKHETAMIQDFLPALIKYRPQLIISEAALGYLTLWALYGLRPFFGFKVILWTHGVPNRMTSNIRTRLWRFMLELSDGIIFYSALRLEKYRALGWGKSLPVWVANNTLDTRLYLSHRESILNEHGFDRSKLRMKLGLKADAQVTYVAFIGRLIPEKTIPLAIKTVLNAEGSQDLRLIIIGDGPEAHKIPSSQKIIWKKSIFDERETMEWLLACDFQFSPGRVGLNIVHGFCAELPLLTCRPGSDGPEHSPEIDYLIHGQNGWMVPQAQLVVTFNKIVSEKSLLYSMRACALDTAQNHCSFEKMLEGFSKMQSDSEFHQISK